MYDFYKAFDRHYKADEIEVTVITHDGRSHDLTGLIGKLFDNVNPLADAYVKYHEGYYLGNLDKYAVVIHRYKSDDYTVQCVSAHDLVRDGILTTEQLQAIPNHDSYSEFVAIFQLTQTSAVPVIIRISEIEIPMVDPDD